MPVRTVHEDNERILSMMSRYLNSYDTVIDKEGISEVMSSGVSEKKAFMLLLSYICGMDVAKKKTDREFFADYFEKMISRLDIAVYKNDPYLKNISFPTASSGTWSMKKDIILPYQGFVWRDMIKEESGRIIPQIGFFSEGFSFPAVYENGKLWMSVVPNETETMKKPISEAKGKVCAIGLGLGYFPYMVSEKEDVGEVRIIERDEKAISLFEEYILPQFKNARKIKIIRSDAFEYLSAKNAAENDFIFCDIWHDVGDGLPLYLKLKEYEKRFSGTRFSYWIEDSIRCYL